jgi:hypothetical protein
MAAGGVVLGALQEPVRQLLDTLVAQSRAADHPQRRHGPNHGQLAVVEQGEQTASHAVDRGLRARA